MEREEAVCKELSDNYAKKQAVEAIAIDSTHDFEVIGSRNTVYFHEQQESTQELPGMKYSAVESYVIESNIENNGSHANGNKFELQDHSTEINLQFEANGGSGSFSDLDVSLMDNLGDEHSSSFRNFAGIPQLNGAFGLITEINQEITELDVENVLQKQDVHDSSFEHLEGKPQRDVTIEIIEETNQEVIELDVEKVIEKQDTHDLYCPNCRTCITKTVILRRRKLKIRNLRKKEKRTIVETPEPVIDDQNCDSTTICSNDSLEADDDDERCDRESIIFRCLSCFSIFIPSGGDVIVTVEQGPTSSQAVQNIVPSAEEEILPRTETLITISQHRDGIVTSTYGVDILKSIVYGGLIESVTSLGVVASAAGAGASTVDVLALGLANMIGGLFVIIHNLKELRIDRARLATNESNVQEDRYQELLGRRENLWLHATLVILSYIIFGLVPPIVYAFSSTKTDIREMKFVAVAVVSLVCIVLLGFGKAHTQTPPKSYFKTALYYVSMAICAAGVAFGAGELIKKLIVKLLWFETSLGTAVAFSEIKPFERAWASY